MRLSTLAAIVLLICSLSSFSLADFPLRPTTTLSGQTANNTSAADRFRGLPNGNLGAGNVSKLPIRSLLYPGADTLIYAHVVPWWGSNRHIDIGYNSQQPAQVRSQVQDMVSRGIDGVIVDWYGPQSFEDRGTRLFLQEAENNPGFQMIVEIEHGAVLWGSCYPKCSATEAVIRLATMVSEDYFSSPSYARSNGRPILMEFGMENVPQRINWEQVKRKTPGNPIWVHRNPGGFNKPKSGGAFAWLQNQEKNNNSKDRNKNRKNNNRNKGNNGNQSESDGKGLGWTGSSYLQNFYKTAKDEPGKLTFGSVYKGFDDEIASWSGGKHIDQHCGETWLHTFDVINSHYSASDPLGAMQLVTWNDYEEGTALETGIDNCVQLSGNLTDGILRWSIGGGNENSIDHFVIYVSADGEHLMPLMQVSAKERSLNLSSFALPSGNYKTYVQAVGKPSIRNHISTAIAYSAAQTSTRAGSAPPSGDSGLEVTVNPGTVKLARGKSTQTDVKLKPAHPVAGQLILACSDLPVGVSCSFSPAIIKPGSSPVNATLTIAAKAGTPTTKISRFGDAGAQFATLLFPGIGVFGFVLVGSNRRTRALISGTLLALLLLALAACGGGSSSMLSDGPAAPGRYTITVSAVSPQVQQFTTATLVIE